MSTQTTTSVSERALLLLETIAKAEEPPTLNELMASIGLPKATTHRFVALLERLGFVQRAADGRHYEIGQRLLALSLEGMRRSFDLAPRRVILAALVKEIGETCNITMLDGERLVYLDRVESDWPLQFRLSVGSHVPLHCTASGKLFLSLSPPPLRKALFRTQPFQRYTARTLTSTEQLEAELTRIRQTGVGTDNEEFMEGMAATAVPIRDSRGRICATVAVHGPVTRLPLARALALVPALKRAAKALEQTLLFDTSSPASAVAVGGSAETMPAAALNPMRPAE
ncbi:IclR family transcriptional regulator [[Pseudomonas] carboxydohydrogena]|uniref:IclR family transcriptional regulator n=1 Tax=Afipia carboxydohydrogena TaxID=290 RepID=A0ABY8BL16_AFICR|nr:IclR family transcriptional regulator [[Pseudomonas] carboxydohydrogena]WEF50675.1 IclR family transcriptional regulator [[Pseudomonas] carboxydohydrogena]